jgi:hypothetical protein
MILSLCFAVLFSGSLLGAELPLSSEQAFFPAPSSVKDLLAEAKSFLRSARTSLDQWRQLPDRLIEGAYLTGVKDGVLGTALVLVILYLLFQQPRKP